MKKALLSLLIGFALTVIALLLLMPRLPSTPVEPSDADLQALVTGFFDDMREGKVQAVYDELSWRVEQRSRVASLLCEVGKDEQIMIIRPAKPRKRSREDMTRLTTWWIASTRGKEGDRVLSVSLVLEERQYRLYGIEDKSFLEWLNRPDTRAE